MTFPPFPPLRAIDEIDRNGPPRGACALDLDQSARATCWRTAAAALEPAIELG
jgi:hypothetical protein